MKKRNQLDVLKARMQDLKDKIAEMEENVEDKITENPIESVSIAFGIGLLAGGVIGAMMRKK
ncbi:hypothetical protein GF323_04775 [Candidatus Woesearchaeota archaeon]|nr:hypothetical protein [Candidatus Woesearchaeota archaeon]